VIQVFLSYFNYAVTYPPRVGTIGLRGGTIGPRGTAPASASLVSTDDVDETESR
jgi:hypothetical protein